MHISETNVYTHKYAVRERERERERVHVLQPLHCRNFQYVKLQKHPSWIRTREECNVIQSSGNNCNPHFIGRLNPKEEITSLRIDKIASICKTFDFGPCRHESSESITIQYCSQPTSWASRKDSLHDFQFAPDYLGQKRKKRIKIRRIGEFIESVHTFCALLIPFDIKSSTIATKALAPLKWRLVAWSKYEMIKENSTKCQQPIQLCTWNKKHRVRG